MLILARAVTTFNTQPHGKRKHVLLIFFWRITGNVNNDAKKSFCYSFLYHDIYNGISFSNSGIIQEMAYMFTTFRFPKTGNNPLSRGLKTG